ENSEDPNIARFLGQEGTLGSDMGLPNDFMARAITHVGNYGEIYERNLGEGSQFELPRAENSLWTEGGLLYSPPFR
ncbi:MAG: amino acid ABC transporter substrate-binding protein, partial [Leptolyngbya sp. SIO4C5]|nr:amino acid ABC transporter substrate-binding protein [Leptolyngbya sp. SIO4C5]